MNDNDNLIKFILSQFKDNKIEEKTALTIVQQLSKKEKQIPDKAIAIVGMDCRLPDAENVAEYWKNLLEEKNSITLLPESRRKDLEPFLPGDAVAKPEDFYARGGFLKEIDTFDGAFFRISPRESVLMEPCQRLVLESAYKALEGGNVLGAEGKNKSVGVYVGLDSTDIHQYSQMVETVGLADILSVTGSLTSIIAGRISYVLGLDGPAQVIDTACSSGLVAVIEACKALNNNDCTVALAGGANIMATPLKGGSILEIESVSDEVRAFDKDAGGIIFSEGVCFVVLKKLDAAIRDKDAIYGVIRASAVNNNGVSSGITAPNPDAQIKLYQKAWEDAGINPETISYIEAQGTGTIIGDTVELESITAAFRKYTDKTGFCGVGSVKSNIGHTKGASGIASLIKVVMALRNRTIPASINFEAPNPRIQLDGSPMYINSRVKKWESAYPLRAGVNSFGFNGTNAHVVVEEYKEPQYRADCPESSALFTLTAKNEQSLKALIHSYIKYLDDNQHYSLENMCYTANIFRPHYNCRIIMLVTSIDDLRVKLANVASHLVTMEELNIYYGACPEKSIGYKKDTGLSGSVQWAELLKVGGQANKALYETVCKHYIMGGLIPWDKIYAEKMQKVNLPGYTFDKKRVWIDTKGYRKAEVKQDRLYPLVDELLINTHDQAIYKTRLSVSTHWPIAEHKIYERHVLPGTALIDMAAFVGVSQWGRNNFCLKDLLFLQTVTLEENESLDLFIIVKKSSGKMEFQFISKQDAASLDFTLHMTGVLASPESNESFRSLPINRALTESSDSYPFDNTKTDGPLVLGPRWRMNGTMYQGKAELLADIAIPSEYQAELRDYHLYPPLMDVAMNYVVGVLGNDIYVPFSVKELHLFGEMSQQISSYVTRADREGHSDEIIYVDVALVNDKGEVFAFLHHYAIKKLRSESMVARELESRFNRNQAIGVVKAGEKYAVNLTGKSVFTLTEQLIGDIWGKVLGFAELDVMADFHQLGGDSIHSIQITNEINRALNIKLDIVHIFDYPSVAELSGYLDSSAIDRSAGQHQVIVARNNREHILSEVQLRIWFIQKLFPDTTIYNLPMTMKLDFPIDPALIEQTINVIIKKHGVFRTVFVEKDNGVRQIILDDHKLAVEVVDFSRWCTELEAVEREIHYENNKPFVYSQPLIIVKLYRINENLHYLYINIHHLISDGWSSPIFVDELMTTYQHISAGVEVDFSEVTPSYVDWIAAMEEWKSSEDYLRQKKYWENELSGPLPVIDLPLDYIRPEKFTYNGDAHVFFLDNELLSKVKNLTVLFNYTGHILMQSFFFLFLNRITGDEDIIIGIPSAGRDNADYEKVIGVFINTLCIRLKWNGLNSLADLLEEVKRINHGALRNGKMPFADLIGFINPVRDMSRNPIFSVFYQYYDNIPPVNEGTSQFDLSLYCRDVEEGVYCRFEYNTDLFSKETIQQFSKIFVGIINVITDLLDTNDSINNKKLARDKAGISLTDTYLLIEKEVADEHYKLSNKRKYWNKQLTGEWPGLQLLCDYAFMANREYNWDTQCIEVDESLLLQINNICTQEHVPLSQFILVVYMVVLSQYGKQEEIMIGTLYNSVNILPLRMYFDDNCSFSSIVQNVEQLLDKARLYGEYPFEKMLEIAAQEQSRRSLFDALYVYEEVERTGMNQDLTVRGEPCPGNPNIVLVCKNIGNKLQLEIRYCTELFKEINILRLGGHILLGLHEFSQNFDQQPANSNFTTAEETAWIADVINHTAAPYAEDQTLVDLFHAQVRKSEEKIALVYGDKGLTYLELNENANRLAHYLAEIGVGPDKVIGVMLERSLDMVVAILGILKAGGTYLPIDVSTPKERIEYILGHASADILLVSEETESGNSGVYKEIRIDSPAIVERSTDDLPVRITPANLAYIMYTSGSTGKPKGVMVSHNNANNFLNWAIKSFSLNENDRLMLVTSISFDISVLEIFGSLLTGAELHIMSMELLFSPSALGNYCRKNKITVWHSVPSLMVQYLSEFDDEHKKAFEIETLRHVMLGGEAWNKDLAHKIRRIFKNAQITNMYGPTETTIWVTSHIIGEQELDHTAILPIGKPIFNNKVYILDAAGKLCGIGIPGEIFISGDNVTQGYYKNDEKTRESFTLHPQYDKLYRTGDLGKYSDNGTIVYLGRKDNQVKVRGYRIELGEIENVMAESNEINQSAIIVRKDGEANMLVCFYEAKEKLTIETLRERLAKKLPEYMLPSQFVYLAKMPLTPNGKIDRQALLTCEISERPNLENEFVEPASDTEKILANIWGSVLDVKKIGVNDNFFALGGYSIKLVQVVTLLKEYNLEASIMDCLKYKTIGELSKHVRRINDSEERFTPQKDNGIGHTETYESYSSQVELTSIEPFNNVFYKGCFYNAYFPVLNHFGKNIDLILANDIVVYNTSETSGHLDLDIDFISVKEFGDIQKTADLSMTVLPCTTHVVSRIIQSLSQGKPVIIPVDCFFENIRTDMYNKTHWPHFLLVYGYDINKKSFKIVEHDDVNNLTYKKCEIDFNILEECHNGYIKYFGTSGENTFFEFDALEHAHNDEGTTTDSTARDSYIANLISSKKMVYDGLLKLKNFIPGFSELIKDEVSVKSINLHNILFSNNNIINAKKSEIFKVERLFDGEISLTSQLEGIKEEWLKIRLLLEKYKITMNYKKNSFDKIINCLEKVVVLEYKYYESLYMYIEPQN